MIDVMKDMSVVMKDETATMVDATVIMTFDESAIGDKKNKMEKTEGKH